MIENIFFLGNPSFSANVLNGLLQNNIKISGIITGPDKKQGRGYQITPTDVAIVAHSYNIPTYKPENIEQLKNILLEKKPDICLVIAYGMIFPADIVNKYFFINIHTSLLPRHRGSSPVQTCLLKNDKETGVTLMKIAEGLDNGDIIANKKIPILPTDTAETLFKKLEALSIKLLTEQLPKHKGWKYLPQDNSFASYCKKIVKEDGFVDLKKDNYLDIYNKYRAFQPWPGIYTYQDNQRIKITELSLSKNKLQIISVQKEGKKQITYKDFLNSNPPLI